MSLFLKPNSILLSRKSKKVVLSKRNFPEVKTIISLMLKTANAQAKDKSKPVMVGLAAVQIGFTKRIILVDLLADGFGKVGNPKIYINPEITWTSKEKIEWYEGCFSTSRVCGIVSRSKSIKIRAFNVEGQEITETHLGYTARIFQHEIDHLNGIRFPDRITDPKNLHWVLKKEFPQYRNAAGWRNWSKKCSFEKWTKIKTI